MGKQKTIAAVALTIGLSVATGCGGASDPVTGAKPPSASSATAPSDPAAAAAWEALMAPTGEYAAYAAYDAVIAAYGPVEPYVTIRAAESRHASALVRQLARLGVEAPANPYLGTVTAPADLATAARSWAQGEVANIALYDRLLAEVADDPQLTRVFTNLRRASEQSHLPAFQAAAANGGVL